MTDKEYVDWQTRLSDEFDVDGYTLSQGSAKDFYLKFRKAKADGLREAAEILRMTPGLVIHSKTTSIFNILEAAATKLDPPAS